MTQARAGFTPWLAAAAMIAGFFVLQWSTLDYGTRINDLPHIADAKVNPDAVRGSALERDVLVAPGAAHEHPDRWLLRFKLYSVEADEVVNIMALARMRPRVLQFDPGFYQYGGAYLYPLGAWFFALNALGAVDLGPLPELLEHEQRMDAVWTLGRLFILIAFCASAVFLFAALRLLAPPAVALFLLAIYLTFPASVAFSQIIKPHWFALVWVNLCLLVLVRAAAAGRLSWRGELVAGVSLGLAVGSALTFAIFSVVVWGWLAGFAWTKRASPAALVRVPAIALGAFIGSNPYYLLNWQGALVERGYAAGWFKPAMDVQALAMFVENSLFTGAGVAGTVLFLALAAWHLVQARDRVTAGLAVSVLLPILIISFVAASLSTWHTNIRYVSYVLPIGLLLAAVARLPARSAVLAGVLSINVLQAVPLKLAYLDENDPGRSTRLQAAAWISDNIPPGEALCLTQTPVPFDVPPFPVGLYDVVSRPCAWWIEVERETDSLAGRPGYELAQRFRPRLSPEGFPLVFGHINPQISIYRRV